MQFVRHHGCVSFVFLTRQDGNCDPTNMEGNANSKSQPTRYRPNMRTINKLRKRLRLCWVNGNLAKIGQPLNTKQVSIICLLYTSDAADE